MRAADRIRRIDQTIADEARECAGKLAMLRALQDALLQQIGVVKTRMGEDLRACAERGETPSCARLLAEASEGAEAVAILDELIADLARNAEARRLALARERDALNVMLNNLDMLRNRIRGPSTPRWVVHDFILRARQHGDEELVAALDFLQGRGLRSVGEQFSEQSQARTR